MDISLSDGRLRRMGYELVSLVSHPQRDSMLTCTILKHNTGAATLLIHMLANKATPMLVSSTVRGFVPALLNTKVAIIFAMLYLLRAAAMVKPPSRSMITGVHIAAKM